MADARKAVTMDLKEPGNYLYLVGLTKKELGGSHFAMCLEPTRHEQAGPLTAVLPPEGRGSLDAALAQVPTVDAALAKRVFAALHRAIDCGLVRSCHDLSEGGLAVAAAEMAFAGGLGATLDLSRVPTDLDKSSPDATAVLLFSESNSRFLCEVRPGDAAAFEAVLDAPHARIGEVSAEGHLRISALSPSVPPVIEAAIVDLKEAWQQPLRWE